MPPPKIVRDKKVKTTPTPALPRGMNLTPQEVHGIQRSAESDILSTGTAIVPNLTSPVPAIFPRVTGKFPVPDITPRLVPKMPVPAISPVARGSIGSGGSIWIQPGENVSSAWERLVGSIPERMKKVNWTEIGLRQNGKPISGLEPGVTGPSAFKKLVSSLSAGVDPNWRLKFVQPQPESAMVDPSFKKSAAALPPPVSAAPAAAVPVVAAPAAPKKAAAKPGIAQPTTTAVVPEAPAAASQIPLAAGIPVESDAMSSFVSRLTPDQKRNFNMALLTAGLSMLAEQPRSTPFAPFETLGRGGLAGVQTYLGLEKADQETAAAKEKMAYERKTDAEKQAFEKHKFLVESKFKLAELNEKLRNATDAASAKAIEREIARIHLMIAKLNLEKAEAEGGGGASGISKSRKEIKMWVEAADNFAKNQPKSSKNLEDIMKEHAYWRRQYITDYAPEAIQDEILGYQPGPTDTTTTTTTGR